MSSTAGIAQYLQALASAASQIVALGAELGNGGIQVALAVTSARAPCQKVSERVVYRAAPPEFEVLALDDPDRAGRLTDKDRRALTPLFWMPRQPTAFQSYLDQHKIPRLTSWRTLGSRPGRLQDPRQSQAEERLGRLAAAGFH
ncbi:hypothetical protein [Streptomyces chartreusis]|uniref:hypothetical protein n=1 Tax=Streptomyces chartreusis TaxID=1969 RepID=UPI0036386FD2